MIKKMFMGFMVLSLALFFVMCGGKTENTEEATVEQPEERPVDQEMVEAEAAGEAVAKEILATFDKAIAEAAELVKDKPEPADVLPKLEELFEMYKAKMVELNGKYLALKDKDIASFGAANGYLGEHRGKHVFDKDQVLGEYVVHYSVMKEQREVGDFLSKKFVELLDIAAKH